MEGPAVVTPRDGGPGVSQRKGLPALLGLVRPEQAHNKGRHEDNEGTVPSPEHARGVLELN